jgi:hypothetical protein
MVEKQEWKDHRKRDPESELLVNRHIRKGIQNKKARHRDRNGGRVIDINRAHEITLLAFKLQAAVETIVVHGEGAPIQVTHVTARTPETKTGAE